MLTALIAHAQVIAIGFSFGIIGPCFLVCTPMLIAYTAGSKKSPYEAVKDILIFLSGRLFAYLVLGLLAGLSAVTLNQFINSGLTRFFKPAGGAISILLGIFILVNRGSAVSSCNTAYCKAYNSAGLFSLGFIVGITPCPPLLALLFEITLISKGVVDALSYALSFGLGTFLSALIVVGAIAGIFTWLPEKVLRSNAAKGVFRAACAAFLILLGLSLMLGRYPPSPVNVFRRG